MAEASSTDAKFLLSRSSNFALSGVDGRAAHINLAMQCCANFPSLARSAENIASSGAKNRTGSKEEGEKREKEKWPRKWQGTETGIKWGVSL